MKNLTVKELKELCKKLGIKGYSRLKKAELVELVAKNTVSEPTSTVTESTDLTVKQVTDGLIKFIALHYPEQYNMLTKAWYKCDVTINSRLTSTLGRCKWNPNTGIIRIELSNKIVSRDEIRNVLGHEIAHALTFLINGNHDHDTTAFVDWCIRLGVSANATVKSNDLRKWKTEKQNNEALKGGFVIELKDGIFFKRLNKKSVSTATKFNARKMTMKQATAVLERLKQCMPESFKESLNIQYYQY